MKNTQCLWYALDKWSAEGGYILFARSTHWCVPHVLHMDKAKELSHYVPNAKLKYPWQSLGGYPGTVVSKDISIRAPISPLCILLGTLILLVSGGIWAINRKLFRKIIWQQ